MKYIVRKARVDIPKDGKFIISRFLIFKIFTLYLLYFKKSNFDFILSLNLFAIWIITKSNFINIISYIVTVSVKSRTVTVTGKRGTVVKPFKHIQVEFLSKSDDKGNYLELNTYLNTYKQAAILNTLKTHINNMIIGVTIGYRYKMLCVKKHFPITPNVLSDIGKIEIKNFIGKKENILIPILPGVTVIKYDKNPEGELWFEGNCKQNVSQNTSLVNQACNVGEKDKRQFLDGIYVSERGLITQ